MDIDKLKDKIRALLAKAASTTFEGEAAVFMAKAYELMERYQIDSFDLDEDPVGHTVGLESQPGMSSYKPLVQIALARFYGAKPVRRLGDGGRFVVDIFGPESSRATLDLMLPYVWEQVCAEGRAWAKERGFNQQKGVREVTKAFVLLVDRMTVERLGRPAEVTSTEHALAVVNAIDAFIKAHYNDDLNPVKLRSKRIYGSASERAGNIRFTEQLSGTKPLALK